MSARLQLGASRFRPHCGASLRLRASEQHATRGGDLADDHADLGNTAQRIKDETHHCVYITCLKQRADGDQVFVARQNTRERFAGDATEQGVLGALLADARSGCFQGGIFHGAIVAKG